MIGITAGIGAPLALPRSARARNKGAGVTCGDSDGGDGFGGEAGAGSAAVAVRVLKVACLRAVCSSLKWMAVALVVFLVRALVSWWSGVEARPEMVVVD